MYTDINGILENIDKNTLINLCNDENADAGMIDFEKESDPVVIIVNKQIKKAEDEVNPFLIPLGVLPFAIVPERIKAITDTIAIKNLYQRNPSFKVNMPESIINDYNNVLKELDAYRRKARVIPGLESIESAKPSSEIKVNKTEADRYFSKDILNKF
jgi:hypothetical protein